LTGPAFGKLLLEGAVVFIDKRGVRRELSGVDVYIHLKGYARARVSHLDVEHPELEHIVGQSRFANIHGVAGGGIRIKLDENTSIYVKHILLGKVLSRNESARAFIGVKEGGIYVGFKREQVRSLEEVAKIHFKLTPL